MLATEVPQNAVQGVEIDESGPEFDWHCFAELVDQFVDVISAEHDQVHADPAMWCEDAICTARRLWTSFPGLRDVADDLVEAVRAEHHREHATPFFCCTHALCVAARSVWGAMD